MTLTKKITRGLTYLATYSIMLGAVLSPFIIKEKRDLRRAEEKLREQISKSADLNRDGTTTHKEWRKIYTSVRPGVHYDEKNPPSDLSFDEFQRYWGQTE